MLLSLRRLATTLLAFALVTPSFSLAAASPAHATESVSPAAVVSAAPGAAAGWKTLFSDTFAGPAGAPIGSGWEHEVGTWGTGAVDRTTASTANVFLDGAGNLQLRALRDSTGAWTSGRVITADKSFSAPAGGRLLMTAALRLPQVGASAGYWSAFWALGRNQQDVIDWPRTGELDMLEAISGKPQFLQTLHCDLLDGGACNEPYGLTSGLLDCSTCSEGFHTYSVLLDRTIAGAEKLEFMVDGVVTHTVKETEVGAEPWKAAMANNFFIILNLAIGGGLPDGLCGCNSAQAPKPSGGSLAVSHVAVYQSEAAAPAPTAPVITGSASVGEKLSAAPGRGGAVTYSWAANGVRISGATAATLTVPASAVGKRITVTVADGAGAHPLTSLPTAAVLPGALSPGMPTISGGAKVGAKLTATAGNWSPSPVALTYRWKANGITIAGATGRTFTIPRALLGMRITVAVTGTKTGYTTKTVTSPATAAVAR